MLMRTTSVSKVVDFLFRHESGRLTAVLTRIFGAENLEMAEDVVQDALLEALHHWTEKGIPENPAGWLFRVAKNKALNIVNLNEAIEIAKKNPVFESDSNARIEVRPIKVMKGINN